MACFEGVKLAHKWPCQQIVIESDYAQVVAKLKAGGGDKSLVATVIGDILMESSLVGGVSFRSIRRVHNKVAHELAHLALRSGVSRASTGIDVPSCILPALNSDSP
jgi:hypothetical protein